jgi:DNA primase
MAGLISPATLEQIRAASDIVEIIGSYLGRMHRAGTNFRALCPFHKEKSPSFFVNPHKQTFHCFGCHKGGDVFTFVKEYESIPFMDVVRRLAERAHIPLEIENQPGQQQARHIKDQLLQIHEQITQRWQAALANDAAGQIARDYLAKRGVPDEAIKLFRLGYAPDSWDDTVNWAKGKGYDAALVEQAGLILKSEKGGHYDRFRGRLMFPICDEQGRVIGFSGRVLAGDEKTAKYVNSPETPIFTKSKVMFGLDKSKRALLDAHAAIICEGQLDLIACFMAGVKNVVAPQGTALTGDHARILKRYVDEVILCFDSDNAGQNAAVRSLDSLLAVGISIRVATLPGGHDPDSFIKQNGGPAFQELINGAQGFFDFFLGRLCAGNDIRTDKGRLTVVREMAQAVKKTGSIMLLDTYAQKTALRLSVSPDSIRAEFKKSPRDERPVEVENEEEVPETPDTPPNSQELWLLKILMQQDELVEWAYHHLDLQWISHPTVRDILTLRFAALSDENWTGVAAWLSQVEEPAAQCLITQALADPVRDAEALLKGTGTRHGLIKLIRDKFVDRQVAAIQLQLARPELKQEEVLEFSGEKLRLRQMKQQPLAPLADAF